MKNFIIKWGDIYFKISSWIFTYLLTTGCVILFWIIYDILKNTGIDYYAEIGIRPRDISFFVSFFIWLNAFTLLVLSTHFIFSIMDIRENVEKILTKKPKEKIKSEESCLLTIIDNIWIPIFIPIVETFFFRSPLFIAQWVFIFIGFGLFIKYSLTGFFDLIKSNQKFTSKVKKVIEKSIAKTENSSSTQLKKTDQKSSYTNNTETQETKVKNEDLSQSISSLCKNLEEDDDENNNKKEDGSNDVIPFWNR